MGYATDECIWPESPVPEEVKSLLADFFRLADTNVEDSGRQMAERVFTPDGIIQTTQRAQGAEQITASRKHAWDQVQERKHSIFRVYTREPFGIDLMLVGQVAMILKDNKNLTIPMSIRVVIEEGPQGHRISYMQVFADSDLLKAALRDRTANGGG